MQVSQVKDLVLQLNIALKLKGITEYIRVKLEGQKMLAKNFFKFGRCCFSEYNFGGSALKCL